MNKTIICMISSCIYASPVLLDIEIVNHSPAQIFIRHKAPTLPQGNTPTLYVTERDDTIVSIHPENSYTYSQTLTPSPFTFELPLMRDNVLLGKAGSSIIGQLMLTINIKDHHLEQYEYQFDHNDDWLNNISHELEIQDNTIFHRIHIH